MSQVLIRGLSDDVVARLKKRARAHGRSLESEVRTILESATSFTPGEARRVVQSWQQRFKGRKMSDSVALLREDRGR